MPNLEKPVNHFKNEEVFTLELRQKLSKSFLELLNKKKEESADIIEIAINVVGLSKEEVAAEHGLQILRSAIEELVQDSSFPEGEERNILLSNLQNLNTSDLKELAYKSRNNNLTPIDMQKMKNPISNPFSGIDSYSNSVKIILDTLEKVLTPEVNAVLHHFGEEIFDKPLKRILSDIQNT